MKLLFVGAHPDDPDHVAGATARLFTRACHEVRFVSMTNGDAGHHTMRGPQLAERRRVESFMAGGVGGLDYKVLNHRDGRLQPTLEIRDQVVGMIREYKPDIVFTHRPNDYHPDHRATSVLVQDASYLLTVPSIAPQTPHLRKMPYICFMEDAFRKPAPFRPEVVVDVGATIDDKIGMLNCHVSQFYEWLPYNMGIEADVPEDPEERREWLGAIVRERAAATAERFRGRLKELYGEERGTAVEYAEAFEVCEYGRPLLPEALKTVFPFFG